MADKKQKNSFYYLLHALLYLHALLPLPILYLLSDIICFLTYHLVGYRKKVIRKNLRNSFPEKSEAELKQIERRFYRYLCDYFVETVKLLNMSEKEIRKRFVFKNPGLINSLTENGNSCLLSLGHYGNWE